MRLLRHFTANEEQLESFPFKRELSMESYLVENEGILALDRENYSDVTIVQEELTLKQGRSSKDTDGRIDILATYSNEYIGVVELKMGELNEIHLTQLEDYLIEKYQILEQFPDILDKNISPEPKWVGVLVGSSIHPDLAHKINNGYSTKCGVPVAALSVQRFKGENGGVYVTTDVFFKNNLSVKDTTKYLFNGGNYGKGRLVLAVLKKFVEENPKVTYSELESTFYKSLQGSSGVFSTQCDAKEVFAKTSRWRHFIKPEELIKLSDSTIAVSSQWGVGNIDRLIQKAIELGYKIGS
ncbi:hypothetical protein [Aliamphritea ceti]|uniref:hypothetical protein n=1 Tax=Aliamphritea ceti TaxID=1524258 RepID=UPI0021C33130|nr:hypothetical protein [Aliamphritea ceti]